MWEYVIGGATVFGLIMGFFSIYNGRATRRVILGEQRETRKVLQGTRDAIDGIKDAIDGIKDAIDGIKDAIDGIKGILERHGEILDRHGKILEKLSEQHMHMIEALKSSRRKVK